MQHLITDHVQTQFLAIQTQVLEEKKLPLFELMSMSYK